MQIKKMLILVIVGLFIGATVSPIVNAINNVKRIKFDDDTPPALDIIKPKNGTYFLKFKLFSFPNDRIVIHGAVLFSYLHYILQTGEWLEMKIQLNAYDIDSGINRVELWFGDGLLLHTDTIEPYDFEITYFAFQPFHWKYKIIAYDNAENYISEYINVYAK